MATRLNLETEANNWIEANGTTPPGNGAERDAWESSVRVTAASDSSYQDTKLKLRKVHGHAPPYPQSQPGSPLLGPMPFKAQMRARRGRQRHSTALTHAGPAADSDFAAPPPPHAQPSPRPCASLWAPFAAR